MKVAFVVAGCLLFACGTVKVFEDPAKPIFFSNNIKTTHPIDSDSLTVISFNIAQAEKIELAISELQAFNQTRPVDIYLLQEMDEAGVKYIAQELQLNYLYIPIVYNKLVKKNIGNAILTKGTITHHQKFMLPHKKWVNGRRRHVAIGEVFLRNRKICVFSVHTETSSMARQKRMEQFDAIIQEAQLQPLSNGPFLIGGDFNTLFPGDAKRAMQKFNDAGFRCETSGHTARAFFGLIKPKEDYIFYKGLKAISAGKLSSSKASDHYPIYTVFQFPTETKLSQSTF